VVLVCILRQIANDSVRLDETEMFACGPQTSGLMAVAVSAACWRMLTVGFVNNVSHTDAWISKSKLFSVDGFL